MYNFLLFCTFPVAEVVIGFIDPPYEFNESGAMASVVVGVVSGSLGTDVDVLLSFSNGSAYSRFTRHTTNSVML